MRQEADRQLGDAKMGLWLAPIAAALALAGCAPEVAVRDAVVTMPAVPGSAGAAYFTLRAAHEGEVLVRIEIERAERVELHETARRHGGTSAMRPLPSPVAFEGRELRFASGGRHAMVHGLDPRLRPGDRIAISFELGSPPMRMVQAEVRAPGDVGHDH